MTIAIIGLVITGMAICNELTDMPHLTPDNAGNVTDITLVDAA